jgi:WD40 repeat protein
MTYIQPFCRRFNHGWWIATLICVLGLTSYAVADGDEQSAKPQEKSEWELTTLDFAKSNVANVTAIAISPDGKLLACALDKAIDEKSRLHSISIVEVSTGKTIHRLRGHPFHVSTLRFIANGKQLVSGDSLGFMNTWDMESEKEKEATRTHDNSVRAIRLSPEGKEFASVASDGTLRLWRDTLETPRLTCKADRDGLCDVSWSPKGDTVAVCSSERIHVWSVDKGEHRAKTTRKYDAISSIDITPDGKSLLAVTGRGNFLVFDYPQLRERADVPLKSVHKRVRSLTGSLCVIAGTGGRLELYDYAAQRQKTLLTEGGTIDDGIDVADVDDSEDGTLICLCRTRDVQIWQRSAVDSKAR